METLIYLAQNIMAEQNYNVLPYCKIEAIDLLTEVNEKYSLSNCRYFFDEIEGGLILAWTFPDSTPLKEVKVKVPNTNNTKAFGSSAWMTYTQSDGTKFQIINPNQKTILKYISLGYE